MDAIATYIGMVIIQLQEELCVACLKPPIFKGILDFFSLQNNPFLGNFTPHPQRTEYSSSLATLVGVN